MKVWRIGIVVIFLLLTIVACQKETDETPIKTGEISGYVYLTDTTAAPGVHVYDKVNQIYGGYTDSNGFFRISIPVGERIVVIDGGIFKKEVPISIEEGESKELFSSAQPLLLVEDTKFKIAVMLGAFDSIQAILEQIGINRITSPDDTLNGYIVYDESNFPTDIETLSKFNLLAFNCDMGRPSIDANTLMNYVQDGGNIYASDWQYWVIDSLNLTSSIFLHSDNGDYATGSQGEVRAAVIDEVLKNQIGKDSVDIVFDHEGWVVIDSVKGSVKVLLSADAQTSTGEVYSSPIALLANPVQNGGQLLYTSFHYEAQATSDDVIKILKMFLLRIAQN